MANLRGNPNPHISEAGKLTRFGAGGNNPHAASAKAKEKPHYKGIRNEVRRICASEVSLDPQASSKQTQETIVTALTPPSQPIPIARLLAAKKVSMGLQGSERMLEAVTLDVDGKLLDRQIQADTTLEQIVTGSYAIDAEETEGEA